jgi:hypothetical protein
LAARGLEVPLSPSWLLRPWVVARAQGVLAGSRRTQRALDRISFNSSI